METRRIARVSSPREHALLRRPTIRGRLLANAHPDGLAVQFRMQMFRGVAPERAAPRQRTSLDHIRLRDTTTKITE